MPRRVVRIRSEQVKRMTMPAAVEFEQLGPKKQVEFRIYLVSTGRAVLQTSKDQQKCASAPHFRPKGFSLQAYVRANFPERKEIHRAEKARKDAAKFG